MYVTVTTLFPRRLRALNDEVPCAPPSLPRGLRGSRLLVRAMHVTVDAQVSSKVAQLSHTI